MSFSCSSKSKGSDKRPVSLPAISDFKEFELHGGNLCKFFDQPIRHRNEDISEFRYKEVEPQVIPTEKEKPVCKYATVQTQTDYRESEAQTDPWDPPFTVRKVLEEPEILSLQKLTYGSGLPASMLEVNYIMKIRENRKLQGIVQTTKNDNCRMKEQIIHNRVKNDWDYLISKNNLMQVSKLKLMESALADELQKHSAKNEKLVTSIRTKKKVEITIMNSKLQQKLQREVRDLERTTPMALGDIKRYEVTVPHKDLHTKISGFHPIDSKELSQLNIDLKEQQNMSFENEVTMPIFQKFNLIKKLVDEAYEQIVEKQRTKLLPEAIYEEYCKGVSVIEAIEMEECERLSLSTERSDSIEVIQRTLRGRFYQKEVLEIIEHQKVGLLEILSCESKKIVPESSKQTKFIEEYSKFKPDADLGLYFESILKQRNASTDE